MGNKSLFDHGKKFTTENKQHSYNLYFYFILSSFKFTEESI